MFERRLREVTKRLSDIQDDHEMHMRRLSQGLECYSDMLHQRQQMLGEWHLYRPVLSDMRRTSWVTYDAIRSGLTRTSWET